MATEPRTKKRLDRVSEAIRPKHYSSRVEKTYIHWVKPYNLTPCPQPRPKAVRSPLD